MMVRTITHRHLILPVLLLALLGCGRPAALSQEVSRGARQSYDEALEHLAFGRTAEAEASFHDAIEAAPDYGPAHFELGKLYRSQKRYDEAVAPLRRTTEVQPDQIAALYYLADVQLKRMDYTAADSAITAYLDHELTGRSLVMGEQIRRNVAFAREAIEEPVPFDPVNAGHMVNSPAAEYFPSVTADGSELFFTRAEGQGRSRHEDILMSRLEAGSWSRPVRFDRPLNTVYNEGAHSIAPSGRYLFFASDRRSGNQGRFDVFMAKRVGDDWLEPRNLGPVVNGHEWDSQPMISADGRSVYFVSTRDGGLGGSDIWVTTITEDGFTDPVNLGPPVNTPLDEQRPQLHPDGQTLYFASTGHPGFGDADLFRSARQPDGSWSEPLNLGWPINTPEQEQGLFVSADGRHAYIASDRAGGAGDQDIYVFELFDANRPDPVVSVKGTVVDDATGDPIEATVRITGLDTTRSVVRSMASDPLTGGFLTTVPADRDYAGAVTATGYLPWTEHFKPGDGGGAPDLLEIRLRRIEVGESVVLNNIFFETDRAEVLPESAVDLGLVVDFLNDNPDVRLEIAGHTDDVGDEAYNLDLSERRARAVRDRLVTLGVDAERLTHRGYGETRPLVPNSDDAARARNRRTEFRIAGE